VSTHGFILTIQIQYSDTHTVPLYYRSRVDETRNRRNVILSFEGRSLRATSRFIFGSKWSASYIIGIGYTRKQRANIHGRCDSLRILSVGECLSKFLFLRPGSRVILVHNASYMGTRKHSESETTKHYYIRVDSDFANEARCWPTKNPTVPESLPLPSCKLFFLFKRSSFVTNWSSATRIQNSWVNRLILLERNFFIGPCPNNEIQVLSLTNFSHTASHFCSKENTVKLGNNLPSFLDFAVIMVFRPGSWHALLFNNLYSQNVGKVGQAARNESSRRIVFAGFQSEFHVRWYEPDFCWRRKEERRIRDPNLKVTLIISNGNSPRKPNLTTSTLAMYFLYELP
jgi:hypothetical protein